MFVCSPTCTGRSGQIRGGSVVVGIAGAGEGSSGLRVAMERALLTWLVPCCGFVVAHFTRWTGRDKGAFITSLLQS